MNIRLIGFFSLDADDFLDGFSDVELANILSELAGVELCKVELVLNYRHHETGGVLLDLQPGLELIIDGLQLFGHFGTSLGLLYQVVYLLVQIRLLNIAGVE